MMALVALGALAGGTVAAQSTSATGAPSSPAPTMVSETSAELLSSTKPSSTSQQVTQTSASSASSESQSSTTSKVVSTNTTEFASSAQNTIATSTVVGTSATSNSPAAGSAIPNGNSGSASDGSLSANTIHILIIIGGVAGGILLIGCLSLFYNKVIRKAAKRRRNEKMHSLSMDGSVPWLNQGPLPPATNSGAVPLRLSDVVTADTTNANIKDNHSFKGSVAGSSVVAVKSIDPQTRRPLKLDPNDPAVSLTDAASLSSTPPTTASVIQMEQVQPADGGGWGYVAAAAPQGYSQFPQFAYAAYHHPHPANAGTQHQYYTTDAATGQPVQHAYYPAYYPQPYGYYVPQGQPYAQAQDYGSSGVSGLSPTQAGYSGYSLGQERSHSSPPAAILLDQQQQQQPQQQQETIRKVMSHSNIAMMSNAAAPPAAVSVSAGGVDATTPEGEAHDNRFDEPSGVGVDVRSSSSTKGKKKPTSQK